MKRKIIIEEENNISKKKQSNTLILILKKILEWLIYMLGYAIVLIIVSCIFKKSFYISNQYFGLYALVASIIIYILNQTIKPILVYLTLPITALTYGLFYPIINVIILYMASYVLGNNFVIKGILIPFIIAILISFLNIIIEHTIIKPILKK